jgi:hypothetical protein
MISGIETVTIVRRTGTGFDEFGLPTHTTTNIQVSGVLVGFDSTKEPVELDGVPQSVFVTLYFPNGTVIESGDEFIIRQERFVKDGRQMDWVSPFDNFDPGVVVKVRQVVG